MFVMIEAEVPGTEELQELKKKLRHHQTDFKQDGNTISIETRLHSQASVEKIVRYFEEANAYKKSLFLIGEPHEVA